MALPPVGTIHADFIVPEGWEVDPASGICTYVGMSVFWYRESGSMTPGYPVALPRSFTFRLPARYLAPHYYPDVEPPAPPDPPEQMPNPEPIPEPEIPAVAPVHNGPQMQTTVRNNNVAIPRRTGGNARAYRAKFNGEELSGTVGIPVTRESTPSEDEED